MIIYTHPTCSTCKRVLQWMSQQGYDYTTIDIRQTPPSKEVFERVLLTGVKRSSILNTSGELYREMNLKDRVAQMSDSELAELLSKNGMLIKRPIICLGDKLTFGSKDSMLNEEWR